MTGVASGSKDSDQSHSTEDSLVEATRPMKEYGPLGALFRKIGRPSITDVPHLREVAQILSEAIGPGEGEAILELEEEGRKYEAGIVEIVGVEGGTIKMHGSSKKMKLTIKKGPANELPAVDVDFTEDEPEADDE